MTFEIRPFRHEDLDLIYTPERADEVYEASWHKKSYWPEGMNGASLAIDAERQAYLFFLPQALNGEQSFFRYLFVMPEGMVRLEMLRYCVFEAQYVSPALRLQAHAVKSLIAEAFATVGLWINGVTDPEDPDAVPRAEIIGL